jgi:hypothetical protein
VGNQKKCVKKKRARKLSRADGPRQWRMYIFGIHFTSLFFGEKIISPAAMEYFTR